MVTGERVVTRAGGFNPTWQRHAAAYAAADRLLGPGPVLDVGAGVGHSFHLLAPRETVGIDVDAAALAAQERETVVADMRALPFADASFASVLLVHSIEHVPDPERALAEARRVLVADGTAVVVTPNRMTFGRPDEVIDPYHYVEYDARQLQSLCAAFFGWVQVLGLFGSPRYRRLVAAEHRHMNRILALDRLRVRRIVPRRARQRLYDAALTLARRRHGVAPAAITRDDFRLGAGMLEAALDLVAIGRPTDRARRCRAQRAGGTAV